MSQTVIISFQVTQTVEIPDGASMYSSYNVVQEALHRAIYSADYVNSSTDECEFIRTRLGAGEYGQSIPMGNGSSQPIISSITFDNIVKMWNTHWRYINKNADDWSSVSAYTSVSESYVPDMSTVFPKVEREEIYPLWRNYTKELQERYEKANMETFRKMICEHFDGMREDGLRECTPLKKSHDNSDFM